MLAEALRSFTGGAVHSLTHDQDNMNSEVIYPLETTYWLCPLCGKELHRRFMSREEFLEAFGYGGDLQVEVDGPDARVSHLATHGISGRRRRLEECPRVQSSDEAWSREEHTQSIISC